MIFERLTSPSQRARARSRVLATLPGLRAKRIWVEGPLPNWKVAQRDSRGYDDVAHVQRVVRATKAVLAGDAGYERDGVAFPDWIPDCSVLCAILRAVADTRGPVQVLDIGGALGGTYLRASRVAAEMITSWTVLEQPAMVDRSNELDLPAAVSFTSDLEAALEGSPELVIFGSVLQYLDRPFDVLRKVTESATRVISFTRTPISQEHSSYPTIEHVPSSIGSMDYPMWVLGRSDIEAAMSGWIPVVDELALGGVMSTSGRNVFEWRNLTFSRAAADCADSSP